MSRYVKLLINLKGTFSEAGYPSVVVYQIHSKSTLKHFVVNVAAGYLNPAELIYLGMNSPSIRHAQGKFVRYWQLGQLAFL